LHIEIFTQRKKTRRKSIGFLKAYRFTSRKPGLEISFRMQIWWQWVNKNDLPLMNKRTVSPDGMYRGFKRKAGALPILYVLVPLKVPATFASIPDSTLKIKPLCILASETQHLLFDF
jgi:hypothetical protein